jgi:hypothetical protein
MDIMPSVDLDVSGSLIIPYLENVGNRTTPCWEWR